jgi:protein SCO1/2
MRNPLLVPIILCLAAVSLAPAATAQSYPDTTGGRGEPLPEELEDVGVTEKLGDPVPLDLVFVDENGREVTLGDYFDGARPVILNLGYLSCPMLCGLVANGLVDAMSAIDMTAGEEFVVLSPSIDHTESPKLAKLKKQSYVERYGRPAAAQGWHWLTGEEDQIRALTDAVGFGFAWNEERKEYAHAAVVIILSPDGRVMRYLYGIQFDPRTLKLSLVEATDGKTGSSLDRFLLYCFQYDAESGRYGPVARNIMKAGGAITVIVLGGVIGGLWLRDRRRRGRDAS